MFLFVGLTASMAQDKKAATVDPAHPTKKEAAAKEHSCPPGCTMACCAKAADGKAEAAPAHNKKACAPGCKKSCCTADAGKKEEHEGHAHPH